MKIGVIIPHRNNRPHFIKNCFRMIDAQTVQPDVIELVNDAPISDKKDITWRYRTGYDRLRNKGIDVVFLIEDDDWYHPRYIEVMMNLWIANGCPEILGHSYTIYYHMYLKKHFIFNHDDRSSAMNSMIKADLDFEWCDDSEPYTDLHLWKTLNGKIVDPGHIICMGMKHGIGMSGGQNHLCKLHRYKNNIDIKSIMDPDSFLFYDQYFEMHPDDAEFIKSEIKKKIYKHD